MSVTWNPSDKHADITLSNGNKTATNDGFDCPRSVRANISKSSGKWYWEVASSNITDVFAGFGTSGASLNTYPGASSTDYCYYNDGTKGHNDSFVGYGASYGDSVIGIALDLDNGKCWWSKDNAWQASGNPAAGTNPAYTGISGTFYPMQGMAPENISTGYFINTGLTYSPPSGFSALEVASTSTTDLLDGKIRIKNVATDLLDGKLDINTPTDLLDGKIRIKDFATDLLDGKAYVIGMATDLLDGKARVALSPTGLLDGKAKITLSTTDLLDGKVVVGIPVTNLLDGKTFITYTGQIDAGAPTPTCSMAATFRYARLQAETPTPAASFRVGKRIESECPVPVFACNAYAGRNPSIIASASVPTCSMRVGLSLSIEAGVPVPTCSMIADTHHLATLYGNVPAPTCEIIADTENVTIISASAPCPRGLFFTTVGNVADIYGRVPCPACSMLAITGTVVKLEGRVPVPGPLVRLHASLMNVSITLEGNMPVPTMTSSVLCSLPSLVLRHERGEVR
jgi:hypothetical protein